MKSLTKVLLVGAAIFGIAKLAKGNCQKNGNCKTGSFKEKRMAFIDKVRNMNDEEYSQFKKEVESGNFRKMREEFRKTQNSAIETTQS